MSTTENSNTPALPDASHVESFANLITLLAKKQRMVEAVEALPAQITEAREAAAAVRQELVNADVAFIGQADEPTPDGRSEHEVATATLTRRALECDQEVKRLEGRLVALEPAIQRLDDEIEAELRIVRNDADHITMLLADALEPEIDRAVELLLPVLGRIAALAEINRSSGVGYIAGSAHIPVAHHVSRPLGLGEYDRAPNRIHLDDATMAVARTEVAPAMQPVKEALALVATHKRYVPIVERAKPYARKGTLVVEGLPRVASERDYR